jgi:cytochrome c peroxidase
VRSQQGKVGFVASGIVAVMTVVALAAWMHFRPAGADPWTDAEIKILRSLSIDGLPEVPQDLTNNVADNPLAAQFGHQLFFEPRLSGTGAISCSTCHQPERRFTDGLAKGQGIGMSKRNTPSIVGAAHSPWLYWDGRKDSLWSQALSPLEDPAEHGGAREQYVAFIASDASYRAMYETAFGEFPDPSIDTAVDEVFANIGKAIAAYERLLMPGRSRFDEYVAAVLAGDQKMQNDTFSDDEVMGLRLFIGAANCTDCHNGALLTNHEFHNTGVISFPGEVPDKGRVAGVREVLVDPFNCAGEFSGAVARRCAELEFVRTGPELIGAFRTPSLRNLDNTAPYMHKGQIETLAGVLQHYNEAPLAMIGHNEVKPLRLARRELSQLEAFLNTLSAPLITDDKWLARPSSGIAHNSSQE